MSKDMIFKVLVCFLGVCSTIGTASYFNMDLSAITLDPATMGFTITGEASGSTLLGRSVRTAGDVNKDGYDDIIIGANTYGGDRGRAYVIYGGKTVDLANIDLSTPLDPHTTGFTITGLVGCYLGYSVNTAGDFDGDGYADIIVGAYGWNSGKGAAYIIYGGENTSMQNFDLSSFTLVPSTTGFWILGSANNDYLGWSVSTAGDINNDGRDDIIVGAFGNTAKKGVAYVIYGVPKSSAQHFDFGTSTLALTAGFILTGKAAGDQLGFFVSSAGDINNDDYDDIIIAANGMTSAGLNSRGTAYVIYGGEKSSMGHINFAVTTLIPSTTGFTISGKAESDELGISVSTAGDINNDGYADIIVGVKTSNTQGESYVIYGGEKPSMANYDFNLGATLTPSTTGFTVKGPAAGSLFGWPVSAAGDLNKDGYNDLIIGAYGTSSSKGAVYIIYGGPNSSRQNIDLSATTLNALTTGFVMLGNSVNDQFGVSVSIAGDINGDGYKDIIVGANTKNSNTGAVYVIHTVCSPCWSCSAANCDECLVSATECTKCAGSYLLYESQCFSTCPETSFAASIDKCEDCSENCKVCSGSTVCTECLDLYFFYQAECVSTCPNATFTTSGGQCEGCSTNCLSCTSQTSCKVCNQGYTLSNSLCILLTSTSTFGQDQAKASQAVSSATQALGGMVSVGSATFPVTALVSKTVQNTRYINLSVTTNLADIYKTWGTNIISWDAPNVISDFDDFKESPPLFYQYNIGSSFLTNFWPTLVNIGIGLATFITCIVLKKLFEEVKYEGWASSLVRNLIMGSFNFTLIQAYACLDEILFYLVIDAKTNPFKGFFSWTSLISAVVFLALGCLLVFFNFWTVKKYQDIKKQNVKGLEDFNERNKYWGLFYSDFRDDDLWSQSFFAFLIMRSTLSSFIITVLYDYPLVQTAFLVILDIGIIGFLVLKKPFNTLEATLCQYYFEIITLLVHICTLVLAFQDTLDTSSETLRVILSTGIIYLNTALVSGSIGFMFVEICKTIRKKIKEKQTEKKYETIAIQTTPEEDFDPVMSSSQRFEPGSRRKQETWEPIHEQGEKSHLMSEFGNHRNMYDFHMDPSEDLNPDNSFLPNINPNNMIDHSKELNTRGGFIRPLPRSLRLSPQKKRPMRPESQIYPGDFVYN